jgi:hypothetical protein
VKRLVRKAAVQITYLKSLVEFIYKTNLQGILNDLYTNFLIKVRSLNLLQLSRCIQQSYTSTCRTAAVRTIDSTTSYFKILEKVGHNGEINTRLTGNNAFLYGSFSCI